MHGYRVPSVITRNPRLGEDHLPVGHKSNLGISLPQIPQMNTGYQSPPLSDLGSRDPWVSQHVGLIHTSPFLNQLPPPLSLSGLDLRHLWLNYSRALLPLQDPQHRLNHAIQIFTRQV